MIFSALLTGILFIVFVYIGGIFAHLFTTKPSLPEECARWNQQRIMEVNLFISGVLFYFFMHYYGLMHPFIQL